MGIDNPSTRISTLRRLIANEYTILILIGVVGLVLRLINLGAEPFWGDEALSTDIVRYFQNVGELVNYIGLVEIHPPLYYIVLHYWTAWFGFTEFVTRSLTVIFGIGIIILTYFLAKEFFKNKKTSLISALIVALLPLQIEMSTDARPYSIYTFFGLLAVYAFCKYRNTNRLRFIFLFVISSIIGLYLHYSFVYIAGPLAIVWLIDLIFIRRGSNISHEFVRWLVAHASIFIGFYPWLSTMFYKMFLRNYVLFGLPAAPDPHIRQSNALEAIINQLIWLKQSGYISQFEIIAIWIFKITLLLFIFGFVISRTREGIKIFSDQDQRPLWILALISVITLLFFIFSPLSVPYTIIYQRHILIWTVYFTILLAYFIGQFSPKKAGVIFSLFLVSLFTFIIDVVQDDSIWDPQHRLKFVAEFISDNYREGDIIMTENAFLRTDFNHYLRPDLSAMSFYPATYYGIDMYNSRETLGLMENETQFRIYLTPGPLVFQKFDNVIKKYKPQRVWLPYFSNPYADLWFTTHGWRKTFWAQGQLLKVDLYESQ